MVPSFDASRTKAYGVTLTNCALFSIVTLHQAALAKIVKSRRTALAGVGGSYEVATAKQELSVKRVIARLQVAQRNFSCFARGLVHRCTYNILMKADYST